MASDNASIISSASKPKTPTEGGKKVGFARPTLIIPPPQARMSSSPYSAGVTYSAAIGPTPEMYGRKASMFMFDQFNGIKDFTLNTAKSGMGIGEKCSYWMYNKVKSWSRKWFTHCFLTIVLLIYTLGGAVIFVTIEGRNEQKVMGTINKDIEELANKLREDWKTIPEKESLKRWEGVAAQKISDFQNKIVETYDKHPLIVLNSGGVWTMWNAIVYCATVYSTIGYGHLYPTTTTGRALTIVYAIIGIPLFLIALTDFGKLFTRGIKFVWSFVRRVYYTGSCRKARKRAHVQEIFKGAQMMYEIATFRRPSMAVDPEDPDTPVPIQSPQIPIQSPQGAPIASSEETQTPTTPALSTFEINDEFNLPISLALFILVSYIIIGAVVYCMWEGWDFFTSFYFVFISMSTIGFGDFVPQQLLCMMVSIFYLVFGLALMSMCINVVQEKLSDTFKQASAKLRATIGFQGEDDSSIATAAADGDLPAVHASAPAAEENDKTTEEIDKTDQENNNTGDNIILIEDVKKS